MTKKQKNSPLDDAMDQLFGNTQTQEEVTDMDDLAMRDITSNVDDSNNEENTPDDDNKSAEEEGNKNAHDDDSEIPEDVLNNINNNTSTSDNEENGEEGNVTEVEEENNEINPDEAQHIGAFFDAFAEALHWDVDDEDKPQSIEGLIEYIEDVVEQNSKPTYADDRIAQLDQYVKNGGRFEDFYVAQQSRQSYDTLDMEDESNQKAVVRDYMKMQGYTDEQITRKIERYEDADMLEDEAADAVNYLKRVREQQLQQAQAEQEQARLYQEQQAIEFMNSLNDSIGSLTNIRGISVPKEDRIALLNYITKTDADGLTQYQKDFNENMVNNLIESAYFTMKGDALLGTATRNGQTSAASKLRTMLRHQTKNHSSRSANDEKVPQAWEIASKFLS